MDTQAAVIFNSGASIVRENVTLRLIYCNARFVLERELRQGDGTSFVHILPLSNEEELYDYATADPYYRDLEHCYATVLQKYRAISKGIYI